MSEHIVHPAVFRLVVWQSRGRLRRMGQRFLLPRRLILSVLAFLLAVAWLGNAALTVWLREPATPQMLRVLLSFGFALYAIWHVSKVAFFRPEEPLEWVPSERELLCTCPLRPRDLLGYKLASVAMTTLLKAGIFTLLLLPDLKNLPVAFTGILLAMLLLELLRLGVEMTAWGMSRRVFLAYRIAVVAALMGFGCTVAVNVAQSGLFGTGVTMDEGVMSRLGELLIELDASVVGWINRPFYPLVETIVAIGSLAMVAMWSVTSCVMVLLSGAAIFWLFPALSRRVAEREKETSRPVELPTEGGDYMATATCRARPTQQIWPLGGTGAVAWRQLMGARRHAGSLVTAMVVPAVLAVAPAFVVADPVVAFLSTSGALALYTFLLLPTALKFDFRRDLDRLPILKGLPIPAGAMVVGQIAAPVIISTLFQAVVLAFAAVVRSQAPLFYVGSVLVLVPMNVLVFALDNLIFLLYPYRMQQEGLEIFLRTMLTFTGKGLLFVLGLGAISAWGLGAASIARIWTNQTGAAVNGYALFSMGILLGMSMLAVGLVLALRRAYDRLNPIEDIPR